MIKVNISPFCDIILVCCFIYIKAKWTNVYMGPFCTKSVIKEDAGVLHYRYSFDDSEEFKVLSLKRNRNMARSQSEDTATVAPLMPLNQRPIKLPATKVRDLQSFLEYLQPSSRLFYESLETGPEMEEKCLDEEN